MLELMEVSQDIGSNSITHILSPPLIQQQLALKYSKREIVVPLLARDAQFAECSGRFERTYVQWLLLSADTRNYIFNHSLSTLPNPV